MKKLTACGRMLSTEALQADYEALLRLDDDVCTRQPVSEAQIAALPTHVHRAQVHRRVLSLSFKRA